MEYHKKRCDNGCMKLGNEKCPLYNYNIAGFHDGELLQAYAIDITSFIGCASYDNGTLTPVEDRISCFDITGCNGECSGEVDGLPHCPYPKEDTIYKITKTQLEEIEHLFSMPEHAMDEEDYEAQKKVIADIQENGVINRESGSNKLPLCEFFGQIDRCQHQEIRKSCPVSDHCAKFYRHIDDLLIQQRQHDIEMKKERKKILSLLVRLKEAFYKYEMDVSDYDFPASLTHRKLIDDLEETIKYLGSNKKGELQ